MKPFLESVVYIYKIYYFTLALFLINLLFGISYKSFLSIASPDFVIIVFVNNNKNNNSQESRISSSKLEK